MSFLSPLEDKEREILDAKDAAGRKESVKAGFHPRFASDPATRVEGPFGPGVARTLSYDER